MNYKDIFEYDIKLFEFITTEYGYNDNAWKLFYNSYIDPDGYSGVGVKTVNNTKLTSDGLLSVKRIKAMEGGFNNKFIESFKKYREIPIIYFPSETGGINVLRASKLEDRIDHTLLDIKHYLEAPDPNQCILIDAYERSKTKKWLASYKKNFNKLVDDMGIKGIFVNEYYEVYDLEGSEGSILEELKNEKDYVKPRSKEYISKWSKQYYDNIKEKINKKINNWKK